MVRISLLLIWSLLPAVSTAFGEESEPEKVVFQPIRVDSDARFFPASVIAYAEISDPPKLLSLVMDHPLREKIESLDAYEAALKSPGYKQFSFGKMMVEGQLGMPWREALETILANGFSVAFDPSTRGVAILVHGQDAASMDLLREKVLAFAKASPNADKIVEGDYRGARTTKMKDLHFANYQDYFLFANQTEFGKQVLDRLVDEGQKTASSSLASSSRFQMAMASRDETAASWAFLDLKALRASLPVAALEDQINNPVLELIVGGIQSALARSPFATATLVADSTRVSVGLATPFDFESIPEQREYFFGPGGNGVGPQLPEVPGTLLTLSTYRNFSDVWLRAGDLFDADVNDGIAQADANLTTLFAGRDFGEDILGAFEPEMGLIVARNDFEGVLPQPTIKLPAFALVFQLREPDSMTRELRRIFQSLIGFLNIVGAMNGQNQLELDMEKMGGRGELVTSQFVAEEDNRESMEAAILFNFSPSIGFRDNQFVISSTKDLARQLTIAEVSATRGRIDDNMRVELDASTLGRVLADNREQLISQNMLEDGNTWEEAAGVIDLLLEVVGYFQKASFRMGNRDGLLQAELGIQVQP